MSREVGRRRRFSIGSITWLRRYSTAISVLGALIVLATYIAKDAVGNDLKDLTVALQSAEDLYTMQLAASQTRQQIREVTDRLDRLAEFVRLSGRVLPVTGEDVILRNMLGVDWAAEDVDSALASLSRLTERIPDRTRNQSSLASLKNDLQRVREKEREVGRLATPTDLPPKGPDRRRVLNASLERAAAEEGPLFDDLAMLREKVEAVSAGIVEEGRAAKQNAEAQMKKWQIVTNVLFISGWILSTFKILVGPESNASVLEQ